MFGLFEKYERIGVFYWGEFTTHKETKELLGRTVFGVECLETKSGRRKVNEHIIGYKGGMTIDGRAFCDVAVRWRNGDITTEQLHDCAKKMNVNFNESLSRLVVAYANQWKTEDVAVSK